MTQRKKIVGLLQCAHDAFGHAPDSRVTTNVLLSALVAGVLAALDPDRLDTDVPFEVPAGKEGARGGFRPWGDRV